MNCSLHRERLLRDTYLGKAALTLLLVVSLLHPVPGYSADDLPPVISREYAKRLILGILQDRLSDATTGINDVDLRNQIFRCMAPPMSAEIDNAFPPGVNELDAAMFRQRVDPQKIIDSAGGSKAKQCLSVVKEKRDQEKLSAAAKQTPFIDMDDLRINIVALNGRALRVRAVGHYVLNTFVLKKNYRDMNPIVVDVEKVDREQRKQLLQRCNDIADGCVVTVYGTVTRQGFAAEHIEF